MQAGRKVLRWVNSSRFYLCSTVRARSRVRRSCCAESGVFFPTDLRTRGIYARLLQANWHVVSTSFVLHCIVLQQSRGFTRYSLRYICRSLDYSSGHRGFLSLSEVFCNFPGGWGCRPLLVYIRPGMVTSQRLITLVDYDR